MAMNSYLMAAAGLSALTCGAHVFAGGPSVARPVLADDALDPVVKYTVYYCWHLVTLVLVAMPAGFALGALRPGSQDVAAVMTALSGAFTLWNVALIAWRYRQPWQLPQWTLFGPITVLGALGLVL